MKEKKQNIFKRVRNWWYSLDKDTRGWLCAVGIWTVDGALIGSAITAAAKNKKMKMIGAGAYDIGFQEGQIAAYREMAENSRPYNMPKNH